MSERRRAVVVTTINPPSPALVTIAQERSDWSLIVVGDQKTPSDWNLPGARYLSVRDQTDVAGEFALQSKINHYCRKNIGYLYGIHDGATVIAETDDDNLPYESFLKNPRQLAKGRRVLGQGHQNVYTHFSEERIWPRGFPLELINESFENALELGPTAEYDCPVQQFLADRDPDVDAVYRLTAPNGVVFDADAESLILGRGTYSAFNSQNTIWWPDAFPLLYLPNFVTFRMTDIWRSFVAQACLHAMDSHIAFHAATVAQERNPHSLLQDFKDEVPGYLFNQRIIELLDGLELSDASHHVGENLYLCYEALVDDGIVPREELALLDLWLKELP